MGESFIDIAGFGGAVQVSYRPSAGFGFFTTEDSFGQRPDVVIPDPRAAVAHLLAIHHVRAPATASSS